MYGAKVKFTPYSRPFAVHNGSKLFIFQAQDQQEFVKWATAFRKLHADAYNDKELWCQDLHPLYRTLMQ